MELENNIKNNIENNIEIQKNQKNFLSNSLSKIINSAIDIGIRALLPDLIENQVIDIKNALLKNGLKGGIETAINSAIDFGKSIQGIFTGDFENINQINYAISKGGIIDTLSQLIDFASDRAYNHNIINSTINKTIKQGKNIILDNISNNIEKELKNQTNLINKIEKNVNNWNKFYLNKDFNNMEKEYNKIEEEFDKIIPIENLIKKVREIEILHNLIKNNGQNFNISEEEKELVRKLN